ncbi:hypothetical protein KY285_000005 [Solanum tuberosum]|nr:hypothetical protein KY284_000005 [Solanum tuberosum]KAH0764134.1 hypothetical protein KY285_000005 [Solanum tuberosum]
MEFEMPQYNFNEKPPSSSKLPLIILVARSNKVTLDNGAILEYDYYNSYRYMFAIMVAGIIYNTLHIPFAVYYLVAKKHLIKHKSFHNFQFYGDKITFGIIATAAGASLGATIDYHLFETFRFVFGIMIMGICYTVLLLPFAAYYMIAKKQLIDHHMFHLVQLIADKV